VSGPMDLSIIVVNTNEWHVLRPCLESVYRETSGLEFEVIVVDNASTDGSPEHLQRTFPDVRVTRNTRNRGFAASNNAGIRIARGAFVLLLNPDTVVHERAIVRMVDLLSRTPGAGIAGCLLRLRNGSVQQSVRAFPALWEVFAEASFLYLLFPRTRLFGHYHMTDFDYLDRRQVDWLCGAFLLVRREVIDRVGLLDEQFFMYTEEVDYCLRARHAGFATWFFPDAEVTHLWGGMNAVNKRVVVWTHGSQMLYFHKHFRGWHGVLIRAIKCWGLANRIIVYAAVGAVTARKSLLAKAYYIWCGLWSILRGNWRYRHGYDGEVEPWPVP
jgi:N-acetylglucosaminyl-diphospho-decaprenol L-rhamnosyltransferase